MPALNRKYKYSGHILVELNDDKVTFTYQDIYYSAIYK